MFTAILQRKIDFFYVTVSLRPCNSNTEPLLVRLANQEVGLGIRITALAETVESYATELDT